MQSQVKRRTVLGAGIWAAVAGAAVSLPRWVRNSPWRSLSSQEARTVDAICAQLIPADQDPGAREAGVVNYIDIQLARSLRRYRSVYRSGLAAIDSASRARFGQAFADLPAGSQTEILQAAERDSKPFFDLILAHCRQGFYGDPRHGGNRNMASWKMLKLPFPMVRGRMHYEEPKQG
jgi:gluconate 2-dehydrogenase gamma chain